MKIDTLTKSLQKYKEAVLKNEFEVQKLLLQYSHSKDTIYSIKEPDDTPLGRKKIGQLLINQFVWLQSIVLIGKEQIRDYVYFAKDLKAIVEHKNIEISDSFNDDYDELLKAWEDLSGILGLISNYKKTKNWSYESWERDADMIYDRISNGSLYFNWLVETFYNDVKSLEIKEITDIINKYQEEHEKIMSKLPKYEPYYNEDNDTEADAFYSTPTNWYDEMKEKWKVTRDENKKSPLPNANKSALYVVVSKDYLNEDGTLKYDIDYKETEK